METGTESDISKVLALQELDVRIREIERELKDIPERKKLEEERLSTHKEEAAVADRNLKGRQAAIKELELEVQTRKERILKLRQQQMALKTNKEFKAVETEVSLAQSEIGGLEDRELEVMAALEEANRHLAGRKAALAEEAVVVQRDVSEWDQRAAGLESEVAELRSRRGALEPKIQARALLKLYERVFARKDRGLVPIDAGVCGGCHMQLPPYVMHELKKEGALVTCNYCGRLLYEQN